jgi:N-acyl-D-amino-acid deacylase
MLALKRQYYFILVCDGRFVLEIVNGIIADGSGGPVFENPGLVIRKDRMYFAVRGSGNPGAKVIDAGKLIIAPGFIDAHSHSDVAVLRNPVAENRILQGITTEVTGNCGFSPFPVTDLNREAMKLEFKRYGVRLRWSTLDEYAKAVDRARPAINIAPLQGHGNLRAAAMGYAGRPPDRRELRLMKSLLSESMRAGSFGLSSGLEYTPSSFADWRELAELCSVVSKYGGVYATHMRNEDDFLEKSIAESLKVSRQAGVRLEISHLKSTRRANWGKVVTVLAELEKKAGRNRGIGWDAYPYSACHTDLTITLPAYIMDGGFTAMLSAVADPRTRSKVAADMERDRDTEDWKAIVVEDITSDQISHFNHRNIRDIARELNVSAPEAVLRLLEINGHDIAIIVHNMAQEDVDMVFTHPMTGIGSDSSVYTGGHPHPRAFGTFPRAFARYVREQRNCPIELMVRKASGLNAERFSIPMRGFLRDGYFADIVIFSPDEIADRSTYEQPSVAPAGIKHLIVNGVPEIEDGKITGRRGGRVLRLHAGS